jgi:hypothetical protein
LQTGALGPIDPRQRFDPRWKLTFHTSTGATVEVVEAAKRPDVPVFPNVTVEALPPLQAEAMFRGFRLLQVRSNKIVRIRYIILEELLRNQFHFPWEDG